MRKAGLTRSRSRRKTTQNGPGTPGAPNDAAVPPPPSSAPGPPNAAPGEQPRRKPTQEEAALTAKNYRLAKELSELRVRHRDETKAVTRLTMENMNLASRCREALSHVAMLKKELAMHQRRAAEALALQRQQSQRMSENGDNAVTSSNLDRIATATSPPPPPPPMKEPVVQPPKQPPQTPQDSQYSFGSSAMFSEQESLSSYGNIDGRGGSVPAASVQQVQSRTLPVSQRPDFDDTVPPDLGMTRKPTVMSSVSLKPDDFGDDVPADEMMIDKDSSSGLGGDSLDLFSGKSTLPVTPEKETYEDTTTPSFGGREEVGRELQSQTGEKGVGAISEERRKSPGFPTPTMMKNQKGSSTMSSIDAFEASFDTTFPVSFSTPSEEPPPSLDIAFDVPEFSDPFFLGSLDGGEGNTSSPFVHPSPVSAPSGNESSFARERDKVGDGLSNSLGGESGANITALSSPIDVPTAAVSGSDAAAAAAGKLPSFDLFPSSAMSTFERGFSEESTGNTPRRSAGADSGNGRNTGFSGDAFFRTPPVYPDSFDGSSSLEAPPPPREKAGAAEARARYDAALGETASAKGSADQENQPQQTKAGKDSAAGKPGSSHSPSLVLKRLQQRRAREKGGSNSSTSAAKTSSDSSEAKSESRKSSRRSLDGDSDSNTQRAAALANGDYGPKIRRSNSNPSAGDTTKGRGGTGKLSPGSMGEEMRQLDAIAASASSGQLSEPASVPSTEPAEEAVGSRRRNVKQPSNETAEEAVGGRRRNVKQPVSYTEPALNTKLRRGDVFFPKQDNSSDGPEENGGKIQVISPTSGPESVDEMDLNPVQSPSAEDVLKDLAENTAALKI